MDPKDPNNGGLQAKDQSGATKKSGKGPGKVANTDSYGQGGVDAVKTPGKTSNTEQLPEGKNGANGGKDEKESKAAQNKADGKSAQPPVLGPSQLPPGKEPAGTVKKPEKKCAAAGKGVGAL